MSAHVSAFALAGLAYAAQRPLERAHRFGAAHAATDIAALLNGLLLMGLGVSLIGRSLGALGGAAPTEFGPALGVAGFGLAVSLAGAALLHHDPAHEVGHGRDLNFRAVHLHVLGDAGAGLLAIAGLSLGRSFGWGWADPLAGALGAALVLVLGLQITCRSLGALVDLRSGRQLHGPGRPSLVRDV